MQWLVDAMTDYMTDERQTHVNNMIALHEEFLKQFPYDKVEQMAVIDYALGWQVQSSFCWWLEYNTNGLGSIKGGAATKHVIYYKRKEQQWSYPAQFSSVDLAWQQLRTHIINWIDVVKQGGSELPTTHLLHNKISRVKIAYLYVKEGLMPIYKAEHLLLFLTKCQVETTETDALRLNRLLYDTIYQHEKMRPFHPIAVMNYLYERFMKNDTVVKISPGANAISWERCFTNGEICIGWNELGNLTQYETFEELRHAIEAQGYYTNASTITKKANEIWDFYNLEAGDIIVANKGISQLIGIGIVSERGYQYQPNYSDYQHTVGVHWTQDYSKEHYIIPVQKRWRTMTIEKFPRAELKRWMEQQPSKQVFDSEMMTSIEAGLQRKGQCILMGPPGTGKTFQAQQFLKWKQQYMDVVYEFVTFHPSYQYEDFIEGYKPVATDNGLVNFQLDEGVFKRFIKQAHQQPNTLFILVIDELNRGNVPKIFGELLTIIEKDKRDFSIRLAQSKESFSIPENVWLIATMNNADRSVKGLDAAFKRRFALIECMPDYALLDVTIDGLTMTLAQIVQRMNGELMRLQGRDLQIGHAYFIEDQQVITTIAQLKAIFEYDIIPLLQDYCFEQYDVLAQIIGESFVDLTIQDINRGIFNSSNMAFIDAIETHFAGQNK